MAKSNLPHQVTPFVGRSDEIAELCELLSNPDCRLITLVGPGGIGKTRLALEAVAQYTATSADRVCFVRFQSTQSVDQMVPAIADALGFTFSGSQDPRVQLLNHLHDKALFLLLDNLEHLLEGVDLFTNILAVAPNIKLIVTSREVLNLREEWLYPVKGLQYPLDDQIEDIESYSAVQLFVTCTRRVRPDFTLDKHQSAIITICQLVEGMPLALELAATWVRALSVSGIVEQIQASIDFLTTSQRNMPPRHQSMRAVFDYSWESLSEEEQSIFCSLAVFRGGFTAQAAMLVADASLQHLASLIDKSLVKLEEDGRYDLHELLRQYAAEKLDQMPGKMEAVLDRHSEYYAEFLHQQKQTIHLHNQAEALKEMDNLRMAWKRAVQYRNLLALQRAAPALHRLYHFQGWHDEGAAMFYLAEDVLSTLSTTQDSHFLLGMMQLFRYFYRPDQPSHPNYPPVDIEAILKLWDDLDERPDMGFALNLALLRLLANFSPPAQVLAIAQKSLTFSRNHHDLSGMTIALSSLAALNYEALGEFNQAHSLLEEALVIDQQIGFNLNARWSESILGSISYIQGQYAVAREHVEASVAHYYTGGISRSLDTALFALGNVTLELDDDATAQRHFAESVQVASNQQRQSEIARAQAGLGIVAALQGDIDTASAHYEVSRVNFQEVSASVQGPSYYPELESLGLLALMLDRHEYALSYYEAVLLRYEKSGYRMPVMCVYCRIGQALLGLGNETRAKFYLFAAFREAADMGAWQVFMESLLGIAQLSTVQPMLAVELLMMIDAHPASNRYSRYQSRRLLNGIEDSFAQAEFAAEVQRRSTLTPEAALSLIEPLLNANIGKIKTKQPLIDPLSQRELAVLTLVAAGLTNQEIADQLYIGVSTVKKHINHIYSKLDVTHRAQAVVYAHILKILP